MKSNFSSKNKVFEVVEKNTLLNFLIQNLPDQSRTTVKSLLSHKQVCINGQVTTQFDAALNPGDRVMIGLDKQHLPFQHPLMDIIYEDDSLIVIHKKAGLLSMSTERIKEKTAYHILSDYVKQETPGCRIFILHRLDRETSGLMMFAKSQEIQEKLQSHWDEVITERKYIAVVEGMPVPSQGTIRSYIAENKAFIVHRTRPDQGKLAITHYKLLKTNQFYSLIELELETGRKNQIRVHMQEKGCPIIGDKKYGSRHNPLHRLALHAFKLCFIHPVSGRLLQFETPIPKRFALLVKNRE